MLGMCTRAESTNRGMIAFDDNLIHYLPPSIFSSQIWYQRLIALLSSYAYAIRFFTRSVALLPYFVVRKLPRELPSGVHIHLSNATMSKPVKVSQNLVKGTPNVDSKATELS